MLLGLKKNILIFSMPPWGSKTEKILRIKFWAQKFNIFFFEPSVENVDFNELLNGIFEFPVGIIPREGTAF